MKTNFSRRAFLGTAATAVVSAGFSSVAARVVAQTDAQGGRLRHPLSKAVITSNLPTDEFCERIKKAGFDGMESTKWDVAVGDARQARMVAEKHDLRIHSVMRAWTDVNHPEKIDADIKSVETAIRTAAACGADAVLWVPCRVGGMKMPDAWDVDIDFDPKTLVVRTVVPGDNSEYKDYIAAQNLATDASIRAIEALIPIAAKEGVRIGLENVWNNLWSTPEFFAAFIHYFDNPWVKCYFDLGNHTKYSRCEEWLKSLGSSIIKLHIKDFSVKEVKGKRGGGPGDWAAIGSGTIDWKSVRKTLDEIRYNGWITLEPAAGDLTEEQHSKFLDEYFGG